MKLDIEAKLNDLKGEAQNIGMKIISQKTKEMRVSSKNKDRLYLGGYEIEKLQILLFGVCGFSGWRYQQRCNRLNK
jgi:hypothetical protein